MGGMPDKRQEPGKRREEQQRLLFVPRLRSAVERAGSGRQVRRIPRESYQGCPSEGDSRMPSNS
ncbi:hypothetical protein Snoj_29550 [Streptomyces nojiriensis]|uniref:Uncharacterized protein n=1 Tax=Streptomyces nojiriensis TaxID=66374 RepID=A0ABQ3SLW6_9ACTN|nr:hypothetical protein JYK04_00383 [Streptomyces nojiriensis]GGS36017.1 hypothetical protein GCM10010205_77670 [Streptomyces nojiriensis]GHI69037.1 hypothetical protein Snoj_29550 [Streptomyces nojiriensis]